MKIFQKTLSSSLSIDRGDTVYSLSIKGVTGTTTVITNGIFKGQSSGAVDFSEGEGATYAATITNPLEGISITTTGTYDIQILIY
jgi:hypothetical protein